MSFYGEMRGKADPLWEAVFGHPFVKGIGDGTLPLDRFEFYLKQDYVYLVDFSRVFALAGAKATGLPEMGNFATLMNVTLNTEMELHRRTCAAFGIPEEALARTRRSLVTSAYTDFLVRTCYEGDLSDILAMLVPCACGYVEIAKRLRSKGIPENRFYKDWIETYSSAEFAEFGDWLIARMDEHADGAPARRKEHWYRLYSESTRYEYLFFDMSWNKEEWPASIMETAGG
ncbi:MAG: thiaminase II [Verrucomicrobiota bacterium]